MKWKETEISKAKEFLKQGCNFFEIAEELGRSRDSVKNKLNRLGLRFEDFNEFREERKCLECNSSFGVIKSDPKKFCNRSCAVTFNNKKGLTGRQVYKGIKFYDYDLKRPKKEKIKYKNFKGQSCEVTYCLNCNKLLPNNAKKGDRKYCDQKCQQEKRKKERISLIEKGLGKFDSKTYKKFLIEKHGEKCMKCGWNERNPFSGKIPIELEHKDGNSENNKLDNLELLCPNCHSLTPTYRALNTGNGRHKRRKRYSEGKSY